MANEGQFSIHKHDSIIIDPDTSARMRLKQAIVASGLFQTSVQAPAPQQLLRSLEDQHGPAWDIVFISSSFEPDTVKAFISDGKAKPKGQDATYILNSYPQEGK